MEVAAAPLVGWDGGGARPGAAWHCARRALHTASAGASRNGAAAGADETAPTLNWEHGATACLPSTGMEKSFGRLERGARRWETAPRALLPPPPLPPPPLSPPLSSLPR